MGIGFWDATFTASHWQSTTNWTKLKIIKDKYLIEHPYNSVATLNKNGTAKSFAISSQANGFSINASAGQYNIEYIDTKGSVQKTQNVHHLGGSMNINHPQIQSGMYLIHVQSNLGESQFLKTIVR